MPASTPLSGLIVALYVTKTHTFLNDAITLCCKTFPPDMMTAAAMFHLPYGCMSMDWQAFNMLYRPEFTPSSIMEPNPDDIFYFNLLTKIILDTNTKLFLQRKYIAINY